MIIVSDRFLNALNGYDDIWVTADLRAIRIEDLDDTHLENIIKMLEREAHSIKEQELKMLQNTTKYPDDLEYYLERAINALKKKNRSAYQLEALQEVVTGDLEEAEESTDKMEEMTNQEYLNSKPLYMKLVAEHDKRLEESKQTTLRQDISNHEDFIKDLKEKLEDSAHSAEYLRRRIVEEQTLLDTKKKELAKKVTKQISRKKSDIRYHV